MLARIKALSLLFSLAAGFSFTTLAQANFSSDSRLQQPEIPLALREAIEKTSYQIRADDHAEAEGAYHSANAAQGLRASFTESGLHLTPSASTAESWAWGMSLRGYGYGERVQPVQSAKLVSCPI
jgi:hypothetical protein